MKPQEDFEGNPLERHDKVVFIPCKGCSITKGVVIGFSPKNIRIEETSTYKHGRLKGQTYTREHLRPPWDVYKL